MERLTKIDGCGQNDLIRCFDCGPEKAGENLENCGYCSEGWQRALNRLAAYEDTGLEPEDIKKAFNEDALLKMTAQYLGTTPDRLREWAKAEQEGRLVVLSTPMIPLVGGDDPTTDSDVYCPKCGESVSGGWPNVEPDCGWKLCQCPFCGQSIDDSKVITREEAEAALAGEGGNT